MAVIYMEHPKHGNKVACSESEAQRDESNGWKRYKLAALLQSPVNALVTKPIDEQVESIESLRKVYEEKFGRKPHHKKNTETLKKELES
jgi:hypothetical protein